MTHLFAVFRGLRAYLSSKPTLRRIVTDQTCRQTVAPTPSYRQLAVALEGEPEELIKVGGEDA